MTRCILILLLACQACFGAAQTALNNSVIAQYAGKSNTNTQWTFLGVDQITRSTNCWTWPIRFSGLIFGRGPNQSKLNGITISLVNASQGITAAHLGGNLVGAFPVYAVGEDDAQYTNSISADWSDPTTDIRVITFSHAWPAAVQPFPILTTNYTAYFTGNSLVNTYMLWFRNNDLTMNAQNVILFDPAQYANDSFVQATGTAGTPFHQIVATGGDSGSPMFFLYGSQPVFAWALHWSNISGPMVSEPSGFAAWSTQLGSSPLTFIDLNPGVGFFMSGAHLEGASL